MEDEVKGIKGWAEMDKPREKAISKGLSTLSDRSEERRVGKEC